MTRTHLATINSFLILNSLCTVLLNTFSQTVELLFAAFEKIPISFCNFSIIL